MTGPRDPAGGPGRGAGARRSAWLWRLGAGLGSLDRGMGRPRGAVMAALGAVLLAAVAMGRGLGTGEICGTNEAAEALVVQQMVERGRFWFPLLNAREPPYKPLLFHWTAAALARAGGLERASEGLVRSPSVLYALAGIVLVFGFGWRWFGPGPAALAALVLGGCYQYLSQGRLAQVDTALVFFETAGLFAGADLLAAAERGSATVRSGRPPGGGRWQAYVAWGALGAALLSKGPVGALLPLTALVLVGLLARGRSAARRLLRPGPLGLFCVLAVGWYALCGLSGHGDFLRRQLASENVGRFFGWLGGMPPWYYVEPLLLGSVPFTLLEPVAIVAAFRPSGREPDGRRRVIVRVLAAFWVATVVFFSAAAYKRRRYLLPACPAAVMLLAWWAHRLGSGSRARAFRGGLAVAAVVAAVGAGVYLPWHQVRKCSGSGYRAPTRPVVAMVGRAPLGAAGLSGIPLPLLYYLDQPVRLLAPERLATFRGFVFVPEDRVRALPAIRDLTPILQFRAGGRRFALFHVRRAPGARPRRTPG